MKQIREEKFMESFVVELRALLLKDYQKDLCALKYSDEESNNDGPLKRLLSDIITKHLNTIPGFTQKVEKVFVGKEVKDDKDAYDALKERKAKWVNPDLCLKIVGNGTVAYETIELKSTKANTIPGSCIKQIDPEEETIFVLHKDNECDVAVGKYYHALVENQKIKLGTDRIRPQISFSALNEWMLNALKDNESEENKKLDMLKNWRNQLVKNMKNDVLAPTKENDDFQKTAKEVMCQLLAEYEGRTEDLIALLKA